MPLVTTSKPVAKQVAQPSYNVKLELITYLPVNPSAPRSHAILPYMPV